MTDQNTYNCQVIKEFRANRGKSGGPMEGRPLLLLTTTGAKSGQLRTTPMMYIPDGDRLLVIASNAGAPIHPDWYYLSDRLSAARTQSVAGRNKIEYCNLVAYPEVTVEVGNEIFEAIAIVTEGLERQRLWTRVIELYPFFADHQAKVTRQIPVIVLERRRG